MGMDTADKPRYVEEKVSTTLQRDLVRPACTGMTKRIKKKSAK
jgi:hypothetical protein